MKIEDYYQHWSISDFKYKSIIEYNNEVLILTIQFYF